MQELALAQEQAQGLNAGFDVLADMLEAPAVEAFQVKTCMLALSIVRQAHY